MAPATRGRRRGRSSATGCLSPRRGRRRRSRRAARQPRLCTCATQPCAALPEEAADREIYSPCAGLRALSASVSVVSAAPGCEVTSQAPLHSPPPPPPAAFLRALRVRDCCERASSATRRAGGQAGGLSCRIVRGSDEKGCPARAAHSYVPLRCPKVTGEAGATKGVSRAQVEHNRRRLEGLCKLEHNRCAHNSTAHHNIQAQQHGTQNALRLFTVGCSD